MDHTSAALAGIAPHVRPGQPQGVAQELDQEGSILDLPRYCTPVDSEIDLSHFAPSHFIHEYLGRAPFGKERAKAVAECINRGDAPASYVGQSPPAAANHGGALFARLCRTADFVTRHSARNGELLPPYTLSRGRRTCRKTKSGAINDWRRA